MLLTLDLLGIFVFALAGGLVAVRKELDVVGVLVLATVTALGGGLMRDVLIGAVPPPGLADWRYLITPIAAGLFVFFFHPALNRLERPVNYADAGGLGLFCVAGALKASDYGLNPLPSAMLGLVTAVGGGVLRDVLVREVPAILRRGELYATPALAGATVAVVGTEAGLEHEAIGPPAAVVAIVWRMLAIHRGWMAPMPGPREKPS
ncbi:trimeric intracellular cation channel family protein [Sporichthya polymorpha]|uniref:trimeric intracellular cation channel family protein n=1 Tax=Sporichthya polymorpha TaxID=35751 RepID=UPI000365B5E1|nr:trimeric intracellular cation channel family protein [Sporichthya polymorpha]